VRRQIEARQQQLQMETELPADIEAKSSKLSLSSLALTLIYEDRILKRGLQADSLARDAGHTSGDSLYNQYCHYLTRINRIGFDSDTARSGRNMIKRIQAVLPSLSASAKQMAENEINMIESRIT
jgi:hypothetical protein